MIIIQLCAAPHSILTARTSKFFPSAHAKAKKKNQKTEALSTICLARVTKPVNQNLYLAHVST